MNWNETQKQTNKKQIQLCLLLLLGGRINSRDVWMYNSQLNLWIRVASLNKGRWRHKMGVLLGKVRRKCTHTWWASVVTAPRLTHSWNSPVGASNDLLSHAWLRSLRGETATEATCLAVTHWAQFFFFFSFLATVGYLSKMCRGLTSLYFNCGTIWQCASPATHFQLKSFRAIKICIISHARPFAVSFPVDLSRSAVKEGILKGSRESVVFECDSSVCCPKVCLGMAAALVAHPEDGEWVGVFQQGRNYLHFYKKHVMSGAHWKKHPAALLCCS